MKRKISHYQIKIFSMSVPTLKRPLSTILESLILSGHSRIYRLHCPLEHIALSYLILEDSSCFLCNQTFLCAIVILCCCYFPLANIYQIACETTKIKYFKD